MVDREIMSLSALFSHLFDSPLTVSSVILRLLVSTFLGSLIGFERENQRQFAGLRTHMLISLGATLFTLVSIFLASHFARQGHFGDPARIAAQIVSGIGFLGAGAIIKFGSSVRGITTAATIWITAAIGTAVGVGLIGTSLLATLIVLVVLILFEQLEARFFAVEFFKVIEIQYLGEDVESARFREVFSRFKIRVRTVDISVGLEDNIHTLRYSVRIRENTNLNSLIRELRKTGVVSKIHISQQLA